MVQQLGKLCHFLRMFSINSPGSPAASCWPCSLEKRRCVPTAPAGGGPRCRYHSSCTLGEHSVCAPARLGTACCVQMAGPWSALRWSGVRRLLPCDGRPAMISSERSQTPETNTACFRFCEPSGNADLQTQRWMHSWPRPRAGMELNGNRM